MASVIVCLNAGTVDGMATAAGILIRYLAVDQDSSAAVPATGSAAPTHDAAALRLEAIHLLLLILQVPLDQVPLVEPRCKPEQEHRELSFAHTIQLKMTLCALA